MIENIFNFFLKCKGFRKHSREASQYFFFILFTRSEPEIVFFMNFMRFFAKNFGYTVNSLSDYMGTYMWVSIDPLGVSNRILSEDFVELGTPIHLGPESRSNGKLPILFSEQPSILLLRSKISILYKLISFLDLLEFRTSIFKLSLS